MKCRDARKQLGLYSYVKFDHARLSSALQAHLDACPACRMWLERIREASDMVRGLPVQQLSGDFTQRVMHGLRLRPAGLGQRLMAGLFGPLRAPTPVVSVSHALALACLLLVLAAGGGLYAAYNDLSADPPTSGGMMVADGVEPTGPGIPVAVGPGDLRPVSSGQSPMPGIEDLILRNENYQMNKPLAADPGIRLVRDSGY